MGVFRRDDALKRIDWWNREALRKDTSQRMSMIQIPSFQRGGGDWEGLPGDIFRIDKIVAKCRSHDLVTYSKKNVETLMEIL